MNFGQNVKEQLDRQGKTVAWLSRETGITPNTLYSMIRRGSTPRPRKAQLIREALGECEKKLMNQHMTTRELAALARMKTSVQTHFNGDLIFDIRVTEDGNRVLVDYMNRKWQWIPAVVLDTSMTEKEARTLLNQFKISSPEYVLSPESHQTRSCYRKAGNE